MAEIIPKIVDRAIKTRQKNFDKKYPELRGITFLQSAFDELLENGTVSVGGRQGNISNDSTWDYYMMWNDIVAIFNRHSKDYYIKRNIEPVNKFTKNIGGYWQESSYTLFPKAAREEK